MTTKQLVHVFEVASKDMDGLTDARGQSTKSMLASDAGIEVSEVRVILGYQVKETLPKKNVRDASMTSSRILLSKRQPTESPYSLPFRTPRSCHTSWVQAGCN